MIIREDLIKDEFAFTVPTMLKWKTQVDNNSLYNTPNSYSIYICGKVFKWIKNNGGLVAMKKRNEEKANILYDYLDSTDFYTAPASKKDRSMMNVTFKTNSQELDEKFVAEAKKHNIVNIKGHRSVGGMRASIYNAMPKEGVIALVEFMKKFEEENK
jgi:phosphoserine aminotransferase